MPLCVFVCRPICLSLCLSYDVSTVTSCVLCAALHIVFALSVELVLMMCRLLLLLRNCFTIIGEYSECNLVYFIGSPSSTH